MRVTNCQVNHINNPIGFMMDQRPVFHWSVEEAKGTKQEKARILVKQGDTIAADTGFADLDSLGTAVEVALKPRTRYKWTVTVRSNKGEEETSSENFFETGKMDESWTGKWIGTKAERIPDTGAFDEECAERHPIFSKNIGIRKAVKRARLYMCGLGLYEVFFDGQRIGNEFLTPYCNNYDAWVQYQTYDVTDIMQKDGKLSVMLGNGWYKGRFGFDPSPKSYYGTDWKLIAELHLVYEDGEEEVVGTDDTWQVTRSDITFSNIYDGEWRDDTLKETAPVPADYVDAPKGTLTERLSLPVVCRQERKPIALLHTPKGETVLDLGQNLAGIWRLHIHGVNRGEKVHLQVGEVLQGGNFYNDNLRTAKAEYWYTSDGTDKVIYPHFTFYGYRYVKIEGMKDLDQDDFTALVLYSDIREIGHLETGNAKINQLISNAEWGKRGNFIDVPTDCPQRDERMGWTGDAEVFAPTALYQSDAWAFYTKYLYDTMTEQKALDGKVPVVIPSFTQKDLAACAWSDETTIIPWVMYLYDGDPKILEEHYPAMKAWVDWVEKRDEQDHAWMNGFHFGDWLALDGDGGVDSVMGGTDNGLTAETYFLYSTRIVARTAELLGNEEDQKHYEDLAQKILEDNIRHYFFTPSGRSAVDTQTAYLLALRFGLSNDEKQMEEGLVRKLKANGGKLQTGFVGTPLLCEELTKIGARDMAYDLLFNEEYPGWLYEVNLGATTIWERWNSMLPDGSVSSTGMNSFNHYSYGAIVDWLYERAAGLRRNPAVPGFRSVCYAPVPDVRLGKVEVSYDSAAGRWAASWEAQDETHIRIRLHVPFGASAEVVLPLVPENVLENKDNPLFADVRDGVCYVESGDYSVSYETTVPMRRVYSTNTVIEDLYANPECLSALKKIDSRLADIPEQYRNLSIRQLCAYFQGTASLEPSVLEEVDKLLFEVR